MQFVHQPLVWGFLLVLLPLLIHLINMLRHRRVQWAAMEFLLKSYKKNRKWVWLKQLLLLLARMAVVALIVGMLAQWVTQGQWLDLMGGKTTHHVVLVDDSYSMSDQRGGGTAFQTALDVVRQIGSNAASRDTRQKLTLVRFSQAQHAAAANSSTVANADEESETETPGLNVDQLADLNAETVTPDFDIALEERRNQMQVTQLPVGPRAALEVARQLTAQAPDERHVVYLVSDFRSKEWDSPAELQSVLEDIDKSGSEVRLVSCVRDQRANLGIVDLKPTDDTRAAGVPLFMNVSVRNFGDAPARNVQLTIRSIAHQDRLGGELEEALAGAPEELPTVFIESIAPGQVVTKRVQVYFGSPGRHVVEAALPEDILPADNRRWCVIDFPVGESVLVVVDDATEQKGAYYLSSTFQPGNRAKTGINPDLKPVSFLRDTSVEEISKYSSIYLLDVGRLDERAISNLEGYVRDGGGLGIFVGDNVDSETYTNSLYAGGQGLLPLELEGDQYLPPSVEDGVADINVEDNEVFSVFLGERNPLIRRVRVERYLEPPTGWTPEAESTVRVLARLRNGSPLAVERKFGQGRVLALLTSLDPTWNNWAQDPSFVVMLLKIQSYLAAPQRPVEYRLVGQPIQVQVDDESYEPNVQFVTPDEGFGERPIFEVEAASPEPDATVLTATLDGFNPQDARAGTQRAGVYEAVLAGRSGGGDVRRYAANVEPAEGNLAMLDAGPLLDKLKPLQLEFHHADDYQYGDVSDDGLNRSLLLMGLLVCLLLGEQILAYVASYHPARGAAR